MENRKQAIPRWLWAIPFLYALVVTLINTATPSFRLIVLAGMLAVVAIGLTALALLDTIKPPRFRPAIPRICLLLAGGFACLGFYLWQMGQTWNLPRAERLAFNNTPFGALGSILLFAGVMGFKTAIERRNAMLQTNMGPENKSRAE
jgi:hypothetical protein